MTWRALSATALNVGAAAARHDGSAAAAGHDGGAAAAGGDGHAARDAPASAAAHGVLNAAARRGGACIVAIASHAVSNGAMRRRGLCLLEVRGLEGLGWELLGNLLKQTDSDMLLKHTTRTHPKVCDRPTVVQTPPL